MYSLERLFYSVAAAASLLAIGVFALFFDIGDMVAAALSPHGALQEWNRSQQIRYALKQAAEGEVMPDESNPALSISRRQGNPTSPYAVGRLHQPPTQNIASRVRKARARLERQGFTHDGFLQMEALHRVDRTYVAPLVGIDRLVARGNKLEALNELEALIARVDPKNLRALNELEGTRYRLVVALEAPPEQVLQVREEQLRLAIAIAETEVAGYRHVPRFKAELVRAEGQLKLLQRQLDRLRNNRVAALKALRTGVAFGRLDAKQVARLKSEVRARGRKLGASDTEQADVMRVIDTFPPGPYAGGSGGG